MKSKYLILQIDIGEGTQWGNTKTINPIKYLFPQLKYCKKFNYDHQLITNSIYEERNKNLIFQKPKKHYSFERYFHFEKNYEFIIYLDNDIYIYPDAKELPKISGLMNVKEPEIVQKYLEVNNLDESFPYYNSGVTFVIKKLQKHYLII